MLAWLLIATALCADDLDARAEALRGELPDDFTVLVEGPWVVVGDEAPAVVEGRARTTVRWATEALQSAYFSAPPAEGWTLWLFKDADSYRHHAKALWGDEPGTPYGYAAHHDLVMNIATGHGTLVHEMVHPFFDTNHPDAAPWFEEGLASLYEQCADRSGHIVGLPNWRLVDLQRAQIHERTIPLRELVSLDRDGFYGSPDAGIHYAQARYLFLWLQDRGWLARYYRAQWHARDTDPTGLQSLLEVTGLQSVERLEKRWRKWVLRQRFP